ncbi:hypothetical protein E6O75_ATG11114 [Venturia nashicola]|uniref:Uncharacterized protein n=1 Tax=Venturia nashicola TaxID=86259 RepID=A0A4Z1PH00_9PEZI|nr:hypothetical protein E6O75_ATG11114 [Venturia nashicola]
MVPAVEGTSLSSLTYLASEPPLNPNDPRLRYASIVLYIARVPGSKDVFLTPLKPLQKIVTASDVENCLYYLHAHTPADESLVNPPEVETPQPVQHVLDPVQESERQSPVLPTPDSARNTGVKRKALPPVASATTRQNVTSSNHHPLPPVPPYPEEDQSWLNPHGPSQFPVAPSQPPPPVHSQHAPYLSNSNPFRDNPVPYKTNADLYRERAAAARKAPQVQPFLPSQMEQSLNPFEEDEPPPLPPRRSTTDLKNEEFLKSTQAVTQLTLIRRHPATGEQWNVADITDPTVYETDTNTSHQARKSGQPLYIDMKTPGYFKFNPKKSTSFTRRLWMEGSLFETSHKSDHGRYQSRESLDEDANGYLMRLHRKSRQDLRDPVMHRLSVENSQKRSRNRGYTFTSPWNGRCEFAPANGGTSLKCRHVLPSTGLVVEPAVPATISELRFNLPSTNTVTSTRPKSSSSSTHRSIFHLHRKSIGSQDSGSTSSLTLPDSHHRRGQSDHGPERNGLGGFLDRQRSPERQLAGAGHSSEGNDSKFDLSLGQELAGGGMAGKHVKLGKLIVEFEGLKMLDLVVASNMALWWRAYEKTL